MSTIKQLRGLDGTMVMGDLPGTPLHISALMLYDPPAPGANALNFDRLHEQFQHMVRDQLPMLRCKVNEVPLQLDMPYWVVDENFELYCHLQHIALPAPGGEDELHHLLNMLHSQALRHDRPLWEAWYIEGINNVPGVAHGGVGLFFKVHHALMDGKTAMRLIDGLHAATADAPLAPQLTLNATGSHRTRHLHTVEANFQPQHRKAFRPCSCRRASRAGIVECLSPDAAKKQQANDRKATHAFQQFRNTGTRCRSRHFQRKSHAAHSATHAGCQLQRNYFVRGRRRLAQLSAQARRTAIDVAGVRRAGKHAQSS